MAKSLVEYHLSISIQNLKKWDYLQQNSYLSGTITWSRNGKKTNSINISVNMIREEVSLHYRTRRYGEDWQDRDYTINLSSTPCHFGNVRYWFLCPQCERRSGTLYSIDGYFICRICGDLRYESQTESQFIRPYSNFFKAGDMYQKIEALRTTTYQGKPTKRFLSLQRRCDKYERESILFRKEMLFRR